MKKLLTKLFNPVKKDLLDVDNGVDFTFKGMGLVGNREK
jgi:hypothetical protein